MAKCEKCGHDPEHNSCALCGAPPNEGGGTLGNYGGKLLTVCCRKDPYKPQRGGK